MTDAMPRQDLKLPPPIGYISREEHAALIREAEAERDEAQRLMQMRHREMLAADELMRKHQGRAVSAEAERDRLAAANAVLEAKVAGLVEAIRDELKTRSAYAVGSGGVTTSREKFAAWSAASERLRALATQEAGTC